MTRIFVSLSITALLLIVANMYVGLTGGDYNGISQELRASVRELQQIRAEIPVDPAAVATGEEKREDVLERFGPLSQHMSLHRMLGVLAAIVALLVNSIGITYFVGTSRWCKEVVAAYGFDPEPVVRSNRLKRRTFAWALAGMLTMVGIVALGGAADPGTLRSTSGEWVTMHLVGAMAGGMFIAFCLFLQYSNIIANQEVIQSLVDQVAAAREARGLERAAAGAEES